MRNQTVDVFHALMKKGWIDRSGNQEIWGYYEDPDVLEELETLGNGLGFEIIRSGDRVYLVPTQENDLFLKNNVDFKKDIGAANEVKVRDLYLMNYLSIYLIYLFYHGEGTDPRCREFISSEDAVKAFSDHCRAAISSAETTAGETEYSDSFIQLANAWLSKTDGSWGSTKLGERYGMLKKLLIKYDRTRDDLFFVFFCIIRPTRKLDDLMPYFLRKERITEIQSWIREVNENAADIET